MLHFDLYSTSIYQAVKWERYPVFRLARPLSKSLAASFTLLLLTFLVGFILDTTTYSALSLLFGLTLISFAAFFFFWSIALFFDARLKQPVLEAPISEAMTRNVAEFLSFDVAKAMDKCLKLAQKKKPPQIDSSALFHFLLEDNPSLGFIFTRLNLNIDGIKDLLGQAVIPPKSLSFSFTFWRKEEVLWTADLEATIQEAVVEAQKNNHQRITFGDVAVALAKHNQIFSNILVEADLKVDDIENLVWWLESLEARIVRSKRFWDKRNLDRHLPVARGWTAGYTITLDHYSTDWTEIIRRRGFQETIGRRQEIEAIERILDGEEINNVLLIGEPGCGRRAIIDALSQKILLGESLERLNYKRVVDLDMVSLLAKTENAEQAEQLLDRIFQESVSAGNVILVIEEFHNYIGGAARPGAIDISGVLANYLHLPQFQLVAITSYAGLHKYIETNPSITSLFDKVEVSDLSQPDTIRLLENTAMARERKYGRFVTYPALREIVSLSSKYIPAVPFPRKAIDLLDEAMVYVSRYTKSSFVLPEHITKIISEKTQIPVGKVQQKEKETLLNLEDLIHKRIINQEEAVNEVAAALRRARAEVSIRKGPMGTFLFLGPTGVGKTETSKALAEIYFGAEEKMIRLDMSEFQSMADVPRLLGSVAQEEGLLTTPVRENPFSLVLLDEIEKAHPNILNLFLQVLDEGWITDGLGRKVHFSNTIIIATSNAGYQLILEAIKKKDEWVALKQKLLDALFAQGTFRPEFINRFDAVVVFTPLSKENLMQIAELLLQKLRKNLAEKNIDFTITDSLKERIVELGYEPTFGARHMKRVIQDKVENVLAKALLSEEVKKGDKIEIESGSFDIRHL